MALEPVLVTLRMRIVGSVPIPFVTQFIAEDDGGRAFVPNEQVESGTDGMLDALAAATRS